MKAERRRKEQRRQVKFECSAEFYQRLSDERLQRNLTLRQLTTEAVERYLDIPEYLHRQTEALARCVDDSVSNVFAEAIQRGILDIVRPMPPEVRGTIILEPLIDGLTDYAKRRASALLRTFPGLRAHKLKPKTSEFIDTTKAILNFLDQLPIEKVRLVRESLALDAKYYRSARVKDERIPRHKRVPKDEQAMETSRNPEREV